MLYYYASAAYQQLIAETCKELEQVIVGSECKEDLFLSESVKQNMSNFTSLETMIIDLQGIKDSDEEIIKAIESIKIMNGQVRFIIIASFYSEGDRLLSKLFGLGIYDIINTGDRNEMVEELKYCLKTGKDYKDAVLYKETIDHSVRKKVKEIDHVTIGLCGTQKRVGTTHNSIVLANYLKNAGYIVALCECNGSGDFKRIKNSFELKGNDTYFIKDGIEYYMDSNSERIKDKPFNFIIKDMGYVKEMDLEQFESCHKQIIISGIKAWEEEYIQAVFDMTDYEQLNKYYYYFNLCPKKIESDVRKGMAELSERIFFTPYTEDPFAARAFVGMDKVIKEYLPESGKIENANPSKKGKKNGKK